MAPGRDALYRIRAAHVGIVLALALLAYALVVSAWQCDDAYITFRTVRNVFEGHGLTWNPGERVQAYTHPLWLFFALLAYGVSGEVFYSMSAVAIGLGLAVAFGIAALGRERPWLAMGAVLALTASRSFVDFAVSGLENPLLSLIVLAGVALTTKPKEPRRELLLSLTVSAAVLTRSDALLLLLPSCLYWTVRGRAWGLTVLGLLPVVLWEAFSFVYYGSFVPNTALAKLNLELPLSFLVPQGLSYFWDSLTRDPITLVATAAASGFVLFRGDAPARWLIAGVFAYGLYVIRIGGDFMSGRFLSAPLVLAIATAVTVATRVPFATVRVWGLPLAALAYAAAWPKSPLRCGTSYGFGWQREEIVRPSGIADERAYYYPSTSLLRVLRRRELLRARNLPVPPYAGAVLGTRFRRSALRVTVFDEVGVFGYFAGEKYVIDQWALADPLLARIPYRRRSDFRIGHYQRTVPTGYRESITSGENRFADAELGEAWAAIQLVTRGPLFSGARFRAIVDLWTGRWAEAFGRAAATSDEAPTKPAPEAPVPDE